MNLIEGLFRKNRQSDLFVPYNRPHVVTGLSITFEFGYFSFAIVFLSSIIIFENKLCKSKNIKKRPSLKKKTARKRNQSRLQDLQHCPYHSAFEEFA